MSSSTAQREETLLASVPKQLLIGGDWRDAEGGRRLQVEDPATGETLAEVADASPADGVAALKAAAAAQKKQTLKHLPKSTRRALGKEAAKARRKAA